jgi:protein TonB
MGALFGGAAASWSMIAVVAALLLWLGPHQRTSTSVPPDFQSAVLVYMEDGVGGGGGSGGDESPEPPKASEIPRVKPVEPDPIPVATPDPVVPPDPMIAAQAPAITSATMLTALGPPNDTSTSLGPGAAGAGPGDGKGGVGSGGNEGLGPDTGPGTGPDAVRPGSGVTNPTLIASAKPSYTSEAMVRRIEGVVRLECTVTSTGNVDECEVVKSLDQHFGLDNEALKAAGRFRFNPGRKEEKPVAVRVAIEIAFNMR